MRYDWSSGWTSAEFYQVGGATYLFTLKVGNVTGMPSGGGGVGHVNYVKADGTIGARK